MQTIRLNSTGPDVELLQQLLCKWGYKVNGTGVFDAETDEALRLHLFEQIGMFAFAVGDDWCENHQACTFRQGQHRIDHL